jgi:cytochrome c-type biogenesis protein CcmH/NrfF
VPAGTRLRRPPPTEGDCTMLWTILIILLIVVLVLFILGRVRGR